jgi:hypothetical protein
MIGLAARTRRVLEEFRRADLAELRDRLDLPRADLKNVRHLRQTLREMLAAGQLRCQGGVYYLTATAPIRGARQQKIWRACCLKAGKGAPFTVRQVAVLAEADPDYAKRCLRFWEGEGCLERVGRQGQRFLYRVSRGWEKRPSPHFNRRAEKRARAKGK